MHISFLLHSLLELPPSLLLLFSPVSFIPPTPHAARNVNTDVNISPILRQYGAILLSSSILSFLFSITPDDIPITSVGGVWTLHKASAIAFTFYHLFPVYRAFKRIQSGEKAFIIPGVEGGKGMGGPGVHLVAHAVVGGLLGLFVFS
ncbi:hypothetical protein TWF481_009203 [Arthrobotrys musiformis]|uniref:Mitochondrial adapter protein MCP1 transmembrane domain-containing protein n=1 Tax=Arthrobotrys musiformis TaxID=47236 RepID=A0AAV9W8S4_9PEZI